MEEHNKLSKVTEVVHKIKKDKQVNRGVNWLWDNRFFLFCVLLMYIGVIISFYHIHTGGILVGFAFGLSFYEEIRNYFFKIKSFYRYRGIYKILLASGVIIYLFWAIPAFILATAFGFFIIILFYWLKDN